MDGNFYIYTDLSALPVDEHEAYLAEGFFSQPPDI